MSKKLLLIFGVLPQLMMGQYTYFNDGYLPPFPEIGSGQSVGLFVKNDTVVTYGYAPFDDGYGRTIIFLNDQGEQIENLIYPEGNIIQSLNYSDVAVKTATGYVYSGGENGYPIIVWQGGFFEELYRMSYDELFTDTTYGEFFSNTKSMDEAIISSGRLIYDLNPDIPGQDFTTLILTKHDLQGNEIWYKEHSLEELGIDDSYYQIFPRGGVFELENHNILVFTSIGNDLDCCVLKFDSLGNYVDHVKWGNTTYSDGNPWPVQISENEFLFSYNIFSNMSGDYFMYKPRIGKLNTVDMSIQVFPLLDHPFCYGQLTDFEATPDGNYAILGYGYNPDGEDMGRAFIIKVDELGNEIWFKEYFPPEDWDTPTAYDLEITSDGGFAFVGNYHPYNQGVFYYKTWVVKTDACGDLIDAGCEPIIQITELQGEQEALRVYPNPVQNVLTVNYPPTGIEFLELFDATGRLVLQQKVNDQAAQHFLNVSQLPSSLYLLLLKDKNGRTLHKTKILKTQN